MELIGYNQKQVQPYLHMIIKGGVYHMAKEITYLVIAEINGEKVPWEEIPEETRLDITDKANRRWFKAIGMEVIGVKKRQ